VKTMRGEDPDQGSVFSYVPLVKWIPKDHPLRPMREMVDVALRSLSPQLDGPYAKTGRPSIAPERLLRALLLQLLYSIRSERVSAKPGTPRPEAGHGDAPTCAGAPRTPFEATGPFAPNPRRGAMTRLRPLASHVDRRSSASC